MRRHAQRIGGHWTLISLARDITAKKYSDERVQRLNRVYEVLSRISALIIRVTDRQELFREACAIAVDAGFKLAWVGLCDRAARKIVPMAWSGADPSYLRLMPLGLDDLDSVPVRVVHDRAPLVINDVRTLVFPILREEALKRGFKSKIVLPLIVDGTVAGVLALYAGEFDYFTADEIKLLRDLAADISFGLDHIEKQERLDYLAYYDALTGMANRSLFLERVSLHLRNATAEGHQLALALVDMEGFKNINDSLGRQAGDDILKQVGEWLGIHAGDIDLVARVGADQFALVLPRVREGGDVMRLAEKILNGFSEHSFVVAGATLRLAMKAGICMFPEDGDNAEMLFRNAEAALKSAKLSGDRILQHTPRMTETVAGRLTLENRLRHALDHAEFVLHYQPKIDLRSGRLTGAEALIRWNDPRSGLVSPARFIPVLEDTGLIHNVGNWALQQVIDDHSRWLRAGYAGVRIAVNFSPLQLRNRNFVSEIRKAMSVDALARAGLELELTESLIMEDVKRSIEVLQAVRKMGVTIAIDDFGTGYSSLSYLSRLPVDTLKIDRSFVLDMGESDQGMALVAGIIRLAHSLRLNVVAEGVETEAQAELLRGLECDEMQGFLFSEAVPSQVFESRFLAGRALQEGSDI